MLENLKILTENTGISGFEDPMAELIEVIITDYCDETKTDKLGNLIAYKKGYKKNPYKIMLAAHMDEIGMMVKKIDENGFIHFTNIGGIDQRTLLAQEITVHGKEDLFGVIAAKPPHLQTVEERKKAVKMKDMIIDVGLSKDEVDKIVTIGDAITINRNLLELENGVISGKALDDRAGVMAIIECFKELSKIKHESDVFGVCTVQEEVGTRGAVVSSYNIVPDIGIAIDVGFGYTPELTKEDTLDLGKGPGIGFGANIHPRIHEKLNEIAKEYNIPCQFDLHPEMSGTDTRSIQITQSGIATGLISIPLRYMHTSVETVDMQDIKNTGKLLAYFISNLDNIDLEELLCL